MYPPCTFHGAGQNYGAVQDILKYVYDAKGGHTTKDKVGEVLFNRGVINAIYDLEAIGTNAHEIPMVLAALATDDKEPPNRVRRSDRR